MSLYATIDHLIALPGVVAVAVESPGHPRAFRGAAEWAVALDAHFATHAACGEPISRFIAGEWTGVYFAQGAEVVGVLIPVGHEIGKSLHRAVRRLSKPGAGPQRKRARRSDPPAGPALAA